MRWTRKAASRRSRLDTYGEVVWFGAAVLALSSGEASFFGITEAKEPFSGKSTK